MIYKENYNKDKVVNIYKIYQDPSILKNIEKNFGEKLFININDNNKNISFNNFKNFEKYVNKIIKNNEKDWKKGIVKKKNFINLNKAISKKIIESDEKWYLRDIPKDSLLITFHYIYNPNKEEGFLHKNISFGKEDLLKNKNIMKQIKNIFKEITQNMNVKCYEENKYCFTVFKSQIYVDKDYKVHIWSFDDNIDYFNEKETYLDILKGIMYHIIDPIFPPKNKVEKYKNFIIL
jgi:hypothetical protein